MPEIQESNIKEDGSKLYIDLDIKIEEDGMQET